MEVHEIGAFEAKNTLGTLLERVQRGEEIVITRRGKPVARPVPNTERIDSIGGSGCAGSASACGQRPWQSPALIGIR
jgi:prevent-host-death family protein